MQLFSLLALPVLLFCARGVECQNQGDLRLVQQGITNASFTAGRLEIYMNSAWGSICADNFDKVDADVACKQLGYSEASALDTSFHTPYGRGRDGPVWMDEVTCSTADLLHILSCSFVDHEETDCDHFSDVAVKCTEEGQLPEPSDLDVRLVGGSYTSQGTPEVHCNGTWAPICPPQGREFGKTEGDAVCRQLGYTESIGIKLSPNKLPMETQVYAKELECPEGADNIVSCETTCGPSEDTSVNNSCVFIECIHSLPYGSLRLSQGPHVAPNASEGRLEVFYDGNWGTVCSSDFDFEAANVSCKQLGFLRAIDYQESVEAGFGEGATDSASLSGVHCTPEDSTLIQCGIRLEQRENCTHLEAVAVFCTNMAITEPTNSSVVTEALSPSPISVENITALVLGASLIFTICAFLLAVYCLHFSFIPYNTKKEQSAHGLYFTEYEGSSLTLNESEYDQKTSEYDTTFMGGKSLDIDWSELDEKLPELTDIVAALEGKSRLKNLRKSSTDSSSSSGQPASHKDRYIKMNTKSSQPTTPRSSASPQPTSKFAVNVPSQHPTLSSPRSSPLPTTTPVPPPLVVKRNLDQQRKSSMEGTDFEPSHSSSTALKLTPAPSKPFRARNTRPKAPSSPTKQGLPTTKGESMSQDSRRTSTSSGSDQKLTSERLVDQQETPTTAASRKPAPYKPAHIGRRKGISSSPAEHDVPTHDETKTSPCNPTSSQSSERDQPLTPVKPAPYKGTRKVSQTKIPTSDVTTNDADGSSLTTREDTDQTSSLDTAVITSPSVVPNSSTDIPDTHTRNHVHHVSFKLE